MQPVPTVAPPIFAAGNPFIVRSYGADWRVQEPRTTLDVAVRYVSYDYPFGASNSGSNGLPTTTLPTNNSDFKLASVLLARQLTPTLNWDVGVYFQHQDIVDAPAVNSSGGITDLRWHVGQRLGLRFVYAHNSLTGGYKDNQFGVIASYTLFGAADQRAAGDGTWPVTVLAVQHPVAAAALNWDDEHRGSNDPQRSGLLRPAPSCDAYAASMERVRMARQ